MITRIKKLNKKSLEKNWWPVVAVTNDLISQPEDIDKQINLIGAMHSVGLLKNSLEPYWKIFESHDEKWIKRCVKRINSSDYDLWAISALLNASIVSVHKELVENGLAPTTFYHYERYDKPDVLMAMYAIHKENTIFAPAIFVGWDKAMKKIVDIARWRAILVEDYSQVKGSMVFEGSGSYFLRSVLPYGEWKILEDDIEIKPEWIIDKPEFLK